MFAQNDLEQVEITIEAAQEKIALMRALDKLRSNKDWKKLIDKGYLENEAVRLVHAKADFTMRDPENQEYLDKAILGVGFLRSYFSKIYQEGNTALRSLEGYEATRESILAEELQGQVEEL